MHLPTELVLQVLQNLPKRDLKNVRLASKDLSVCAAGFLFLKLYISKQKEDLDAFEGATNHPVIRKCVRTFQYDAVVFSTELSEAQHYNRLWNQVASLVQYIDNYHHGRRHSDSGRIFDSPDPQIEEFVRHCRNADMTSMDLATRAAERDRNLMQHEEEFMQHEEEFMKFAFIKRGYRKWVERAMFERLHMQDQDFLGVLIPGLQKLDHLDSVSLSGEWWYFEGGKVSKSPFGSLVRRHWDPYTVAPLRWDSTPSHTPSHPSYGSTGRFWTIISALSMASKHPRVFECEGTVLPSAFEITAESSRPDNCRLARGCRTFAGLQSLRLRLSSLVIFHYQIRPVLYDNMTGLQELLNHMSMLETLELNVPWTGWNRPRTPFRYNLIFPKSGIWERLTTFSIAFLAIHLHELIELLFLKMPNLRRLHLDAIELLEGTWQAMVELFKYGLRSLEHFQIHKFTHLNHLEGSDFLVVWELQNRLVDLENYILNGRDNLNLRHPCLRPEDPIEKSLAYLTELLRQCESKGANGSLAAGVVQSQIDYSTMAYRRWRLTRSDAIIGEQA